MDAPVYIGDEISAAGWRLAGVRVIVPDPGAEAEALADARAGAPLVLVSAATALHIDEALLASAGAALAPLLLVVPDPQGEAPVPDLARRLRAQLGLES